MGLWQNSNIAAASYQLYQSFSVLHMLSSLKGDVVYLTGYITSDINLTTAQAYAMSPCKGSKLFTIRQVT